MFILYTGRRNYLQSYHITKCKRLSMPASSNGTIPYINFCTNESVQSVVKNQNHTAISLAPKRALLHLIKWSEKSNRISFLLSYSFAIILLANVITRTIIYLRICIFVDATVHFFYLVKLLLKLFIQLELNNVY